VLAGGRKLRRRGGNDDPAGRRGASLVALLATLAAWVAALCAQVSPALAAPARHRALVERVEWEMSDAGASVIVVVKGAVEYRSHFAPADPATGLPPRAYVDLHPAQLGDQITREPLIVDDRLVRRIRLGQFDKDTVRVVLDLSRPARLRVETRDRPTRLMLRLARGQSDGAVAGVEDRVAPRPTELARIREAELEAEAARRREAELARIREAELAAEAARRKEAELARIREAELEAEAARRREAELARIREAELEAEAARRREAELARIREAELAAEAERRREAELARSREAQEVDRSAPAPRAALEPSRGWEDERLPPRRRSDLGPSGEDDAEERAAPELRSDLARSDEAEERPRPTPGLAARSPPLFLAQGVEVSRSTARLEPLPPPPTEPPPLATARPAPTARPTASLGPTAEPKTVVIDPGHGGKDPGAEGAFGVPEKDVTLALAYLIKDKLEEEGGVRVVLTRTDDRYVSLEERTATANAQGAELFVSIHANASESESLAGVETYTLNNTDDRATIRLAALENGLTLAGAAPGEQDLAYILSDLVQTGKEDESVALARAVQNQLVRYLRGRWKNVSDLGVKKGPFYVLVGAYMPCALVEVGFLTHPIEGPRMATHRYQRDIAEGVAEGIRRFLVSPPPGANL
jgi:N-acetylmuramoyl-L-alanine amidase